MLEKDVESRVCDYAKTKGMLVYKFTSPNRAAVPDRLLFSQIPEWLIPIIAKYVRLIEFKRPGAKATSAQMREHQRLRAVGLTVDVIDDVGEGKAKIDFMAGDQ